jgi:hypothetical protein
MTLMYHEPTGIQNTDPQDTEQPAPGSSNAPASSTAPQGGDSQK